MSEEINHSRRRFLNTAVTALAAAAVPLGIIGCRTQSLTLTANELPVEGNLPSLVGATEWLNSKPLTATDLRGKIVLVGFWNYTCINWLRQLPYLRAWAEKYKNQGLIIVGVHSPEFEFEKTIENVRRAANNLRVEYPIAVDSDHAVWRAFENEYYPALYFADVSGKIRHHQFGEGEYEQSEKIIQQLLAEAGTGGGNRESVEVNARSVEAAADWDDLKSPETYLGFERTENFASSGVTAQLTLNHWSLSGDWTFAKQFVALNRSGGRIAYRFHARDVHLVMKPKAQGDAVRFRVTLDGQPPNAARGIDVDEQGSGTLTEPRMYQLIRQQKPISDRLFEIEFLAAGAEAFAFTFG